MPYPRLPACICLFFVLIILLDMGTGVPLCSGEDLQPNIAIVVSQKIKPYLDAVEGVEEVLSDQRDTGWEVFILGSDVAADHDYLVGKIRDRRVSVLLAVGPEAMAFVWRSFPGETPHKLYAMVMKPGRLLPGAESLCGIPLDIPASRHLLEFSHYAPFIKRIGILYDPDNNAGFASEADEAASQYGVRIVHLKIHSRRDILPVFRERRFQIDALWMIPDATVISESIVSFLIKESIATNIAVLGYNRFFSKSGAALSLVRDYRAIGRHAAAMALASIAGQPCTQETPDYRVMINSEVLEAIGYARKPDVHDTAGEVPE
jgi:putative tryptophan/tyrosine transport system substrate-binding protein